MLLPYSEGYAGPRRHATPANVGGEPKLAPSKQHRLNGMLNGRLSSSRCYVSGNLVNG
jgi:hypothetical protein